MECWCDRGGYRDLLTEAARVYPDRASAWGRFLAESKSSASHQGFWIAVNDQDEFHMLRHDRWRFTNAVRSEFRGKRGPAKAGGRRQHRRCSGKPPCSEYLRVHGPLLEPLSSPSAYSHRRPPARRDCTGIRPVGGPLRPGVPQIDGPGAPCLAAEAGVEYAMTLCGRRIHRYPRSPCPAASPIIAASAVSSLGRPAKALATGDAWQSSRN